MALLPGVQAQRCPTLFGLITDPPGDAVRDPRANPAPDIVSASIAVSGGVARFSVRFAPGAFDRTTTYVVFHLDTDQNPATGVQGGNGVNVDYGIPGVDYIVTFGSSLRGQDVFVTRFDGGFRGTAAGVVTTTQDGLDAAVPLSLLGNDDGRLNFKLFAQFLVVGSQVTTVTTDIATNVGATVGTTCSAGQIVDPTGDRTPGPAGQNPPDLTFVRAYLEAGNLLINLRFAPGTLSRGSTAVHFLMDLDQNPATGLADGRGLGLEMFLNIGATAAGQAYLSLPGAPILRTFPITYVTDGIDLSVPLSTLNDDGLLDFNVTSFISLGGPQLIGVDYAPNVGLPNATTANVSVLDASLSQTGFTFRAVQGGAVEPAKPFLLLRGTPNATYDVTVSTISGGPWLQATPGRVTFSATNLPQVQVSVNSAGLIPDTYYGLVTVGDTAGLSEPQLVTIVLIVLPSGSTPAPIVEPAGLAFTGTVNGAAPAAQRVRILNLAGRAVTYTSAASQPWLRLQQPTGMVAAGQSLDVNALVTLTGLVVGTYSGRITLTFSDGTTAIIEVALRVNPVGTTASREALNETHGGCHPTRLIPLLTLIGANFSSPTAWPTPIEARIIDDCGAAFLNGTVSTSFSNGDPPLVLASQRNGRWSATWTPRNARAAGVIVTLRATDPSTGVAGQVAVTGGAPENADVPVLSSGGVVGSASYNVDPSPGTLVSVFGSALARGISSAERLPLETRLLDTSVVLGGRALPLVFSSGGQINALIPYNLPPNTVAQMIVRRGNAISTPEPVAISDSQPAVFTLDLSGNGQGHIYRATAAGEQILASAGSAVTAGDVIVIYCAGLGAVDPPVAAGVAVPDAFLTRTVNKVTVTIGGLEAEAPFSGLTPNFTGLYQVNAIMPPGVAAGAAVPVVLTVADRSSKPVTIAVR